MTADGFLETLALVIAGAAGAVLLTRRLFVPNIVAYIIAGVVIGPVLGLIAIESPAGKGGGHSSLELVGEIGIVLLLFLVGLELSFSRLRDIGKVAVYAGLGQVVFTAIGGFGLGLWLGFDTMSAIFIATALTFSSTVVVVKLLEQKGHIRSLYGRIAIGIFLVQDLVVIVILTFLAGLDGSGEVDTDEVLTGIAKAFGGMLALLAVILVATRYLLPVPFRWAARSGETLFVWALAWCFGCVLAAEWMDLSPEIGAFLAGVSLAQLPCAHELLRRVQPVMNVFVAVFFVSLGARMDLASAFDEIGSSLALSLFVLLGNPLIFIVIIVRQGYDRRTAFMAGVTVAQISEFSFIFVAMGVNGGLVDSAVMSVTALVGFVTIALSSYMILYSETLYRWVEATGLLRRLRPPEGGGAGGGERGDLPAERSGHLVVVGMSPLGRLLVERLVAAGHTVLAVDLDPGALEGLPCETLMGDIDSAAVVDEASVPDARAVFGAMSRPESAHLLAWRCHRLGVPVAIETGDLRQVELAQALDLKGFIDARSLGALALEGLLADTREQRLAAEDAS